MAELSLKHIYKVYPNGCKAVSDFNMEIQDKEFIVFVGPSGCGKSTTLRMIAGLEDISAGELYIGNNLVNDMEPKDRDIAMVFQNYALYPHMTVYDNMAFGLKLKHVSPEEIHKKVLWAANILKLTDYLDVKPRAMSGGQRQRVALGRAILRNPKVFLLDEPLSNLDAKLRTEMRAEISKLHQELKTTFIYVTHDQVEAMTMGTRIVVMKLGFIQQIDTPTNLYNYPINKFVAGFIGTPQMNFFEATLKRDGDLVKIKFDYCDNELIVPFNELIKVNPSYLNGDRHVYVGLRCEHISIDSENKDTKNVVSLKISHFEQLGAETLIYSDMNMEGNGFDETSTRVISKSYKGMMGLKPGDVVQAHFDMKTASFFDKETEKTIVPRIPEENVFDCKISNNTLSFLGLDLKLPMAMACKDVEKGELYIPSDSINICDKDKGEIQAKVIMIEDINNDKLVHLSINNRTFFATTPCNFKENSIVGISFDHKRLGVKENNKFVITPLCDHDEFISNFTNIDFMSRAQKTLIVETKNMVNKKISELQQEEKMKYAEIWPTPEVLKIYKADYHKEVSDLRAQCSYEIGTGDFSRKGKKNAHAKYDKLINEVKIKYEAKVASYQEKINSNSSLSEEQHQEIASKQDAVKQLYASYYAEIEGAYESYVNEISTNSKRIALKRKMFEANKLRDFKFSYCEFKDLESEKLEEEVDEAKMSIIHHDFLIKEIDLLKSSNIGKYVALGLKKEYGLKIADDEHEIEALKAKIVVKNNAELTDEDRENKQKIVTLKAHIVHLKEERENKLYDCKNLFNTFYFNINGDFVEVPLLFKNKIINALGAGVFNTTYRIEASHYCYELSENNGFSAKVLNILDYGDEKFAVCETNKNIIYVKCDKIFTVGEIVNLDINPKDLKIFDKKFDIRLA